jgi:acyl-CoA thioester hydrolase
MARIDRARLTEGVFPYRLEVPTRFSDLDMQGHINNVAVAGIVQEARARFAQDMGLGALVRERGCALMVASLLIEYAGEMRHPPPVEVSVGLLEIGRTSYRVAQVVRQEGRIGAFAEMVQVASKNGASAPFDDAWREKLESLLIK